MFQNREKEKASEQVTTTTTTKPNLHIISIFYLIFFLKKKKKIIFPKLKNVNSNFDIFSFFIHSFILVHHILNFFLRGEFIMIIFIFVSKF